MRRILLSSALATMLIIVYGGSAQAAVSSPVKVGTPFESGPPSVAVQPSGAAIIAWANTKDLAGANNFVQWCVVPVGATACMASGNLQPADGAQYIDGVSVMLSGSTVLIVADVYGAQSPDGVTGTDYEAVQEWQSTDGGKTFNIVNGGKAIASGDPSADTQPLNAVTLPGGGDLGFAFNTAAAFPTFHAFSLTAPTSCGRASGACPDGYGTLEPNTNPDTISNAGGNFASNTTGVLGIYNTDFTNGPLGCSNAQTVPFGTAFVYGTGAQSPTNNYNVSPGQPNSAWRTAATQADCNVDYPAAGAGPGGFGVLEDNELTHQAVYHRFDQATTSFSAPPAIVSADGEQQPAVSQDAAGGVYATYLDGGAGGPVSLSYSADGGNTWSGPATLHAAGASDHVTSSVGAAGQGWAAWTDNGSVFAQPFVAKDAVLPASVATNATSNGTTVVLTVNCASFPCTITITLTASETVIVKAGEARVGEKKTKTRKKTIKLGTGKFTIKKKGARKLAVKLSRAGRTFLAARHGKVKLNASLAERASEHTVASKRVVNVKLSKPKRKKK